ncbi:serine/threonine-protein kinase [Nocardiopsis rhodophaea]|uniref:serine/threonine-protein kinase n=1 Tax=Nocardiopsis rhodophaea TaxID=280238 RepID=UPI0031E3FD18
MTDESPARFSCLLNDDPRSIGPYRPIGRVGSGGMGAVFAAPGSGGHYVAVKVVRDELAADPEFRARFAREVDLASRVRSVCVPELLGADTSSERPWLATAYIPGPTLRQHIQHNGPLSGGRLLGLAAGLADALAAVHAAGIVHRDLKPGNVLLSPSGPKVLDFGIARALEETALTRTGGIIGTAGWMSPEQSGAGGGALTDRSDMFSWGALLAYAATGREPFGSGPPDALAYRIRNGEPDLDGVPDELRPLVQAALSKDPGVRPTAVDALRFVEKLWGVTRGPAFSPATDPAAVAPALLAAEWVGMEAAAPKPPQSRRRVPMVLGAVAGVLVLTAAAAGAAQLTGAAPWSKLRDPAPNTGSASPLSDGGDSEKTGDGTSEDGGDAGGSGDSSDAGDGAEGGEGAASGPPTEAVAKVEAATDSAEAGPSSARGDVAEFATRAGGGIYGTYAYVYEMTSTGDGVAFTVNGQTDGVRVQAPGFTHEAFYVIADGEKILPQADFSYTPDPNAPQGQEAGRFSLTFPGAPERALLAYQSPDTPNAGTLPPVGICYDLDQGGYFTLDYETCT